MSRAILVFEDYPRYFKEISKLIHEHISIPDENVLHARSVAEARMLLEERGDIACVIADLWVERSVLDSEQGPALLKWILANMRLSHIPVLVISAHQDAIDDLNQDLGKRVMFVNRTSDYSRLLDVLIPFIEGAWGTI